MCVCVCVDCRFVCAAWFVRCFIFFHFSFLSSSIFSICSRLILGVWLLPSTLLLLLLLATLRYFFFCCALFTHSSPRIICDPKSIQFLIWLTWISLLKWARYEIGQGICFEFVLSSLIFSSRWTTLLFLFSFSSHPSRVVCVLATQTKWFSCYCYTVFLSSPFAQLHSHLCLILVDGIQLRKDMDIRKWSQFSCVYFFPLILLLLLLVSISVFFLFLLRICLVRLDACVYWL